MHPLLVFDLTLFDTVAAFLQKLLMPLLENAMYFLASRRHAAINFGVPPVEHRLAFQQSRRDNGIGVYVCDAAGPYRNLLAARIADIGLALVYLVIGSGFVAVRSARRIVRGFMVGAAHTHGRGRGFDRVAIAIAGADKPGDYAQRAL